MDDQPAQLLEVATGATVDAVVPARLPAEVVVATDTLWKPLRRALAVEHSHWDWSLKTGRLVLPGARIMSLECRGEIEGTAFVFDIGYVGRLPPAVDQPLVYVDFLEAAPWNLRSFAGGSRFRGVGQTLLIATIRLSESLGYDGRIGLHSLPQTEHFYAHTCQMTAFGPDRGYYNLWCFEWSVEQAHQFATRGRP